jgi:hypothetical protein
LDPRGRCGMISGETLQKFVGEDTQEEWSVDFVTHLSGVLLAAEYLKLSLDPSQAALDAQRNTFKFQFWRPVSAEANKIYHTPTEDACFCQSSASRSAMMSLRVQESSYKRSSYKSRGSLLYLHKRIVIVQFSLRNDILLCIIESNILGPYFMEGRWKSFAS